MTASKDTEGSLCVDCGLCCDGTYLVRGHIFPEDSEALSMGRVEVVELEGKPFFKQPCPHFTGSCCSIYQARFSVCRTYKCKLLQEYEKGEIAYPEAKQAIATAKTLVAAVSATDPSAAKGNVRIRLRKELAELHGAAGSEQRTEIAKRLLNMIALDEFLKRRFRRNDKSARESTETADPPAIST